MADIVYPTFLFTYFVYRHSFNNPDAMPGNAICLLLSTLAWIGAHCSVFSLIAIARKRYWAVVCPLSILSAKTHLAKLEGAMIILQSVYRIYKVMQKISGHLHRKILFHQFHYNFISTHTSVLRLFPEIEFNSNANIFF